MLSEGGRKAPSRSLATLKYGWDLNELVHGGLQPSATADFLRIRCQGGVSIHHRSGLSESLTYTHDSGFEA